MGQSIRKQNKINSAFPAQAQLTYLSGFHRFIRQWNNSALVAASLCAWSLFFFIDSQWWIFSIRCQRYDPLSQARIQFLTKYSSYNKYFSSLPTPPSLFSQRKGGQRDGKEKNCLRKTYGLKGQFKKKIAQTPSNGDFDYISIKIGHVKC